MGGIYGKNVYELLRDYFRTKSMTDSFTKQDITKYFEEKYPKIKVGSIFAHFNWFVTNWPNRPRRSAGKEEEWDWLVKEGDTYRRYNKGVDNPPKYNGREDEEEDSFEEYESEEDVVKNKNAQSFAYEDDLRDYLAKNLQMMGLKLYEDKDNDIDGVEFPVGGKSIDILAVDKNNDFVVIELKVSKGCYKAVGQILTYIAWIKKNMVDDGQKVRGIIICKKITEDLMLACSDQPNIELYEYTLSVELNKVGGK
jgi:hypothetical protein